jgi:hypothetical protein
MFFPDAPAIHLTDAFWTPHYGVSFQIQTYGERDRQTAREIQT